MGTKSKSHLPDRKSAPKKNGKRGPRPLDPGEDFESPTRKEAEQQELLQLPTQPAIQNGKMAMHFAKFVTDKSKNQNRIVNMDFSLELDPEHKGQLPKEIEDAWKDLQRGSVKRIDPDGIGTQNVSISLTPDGKEDISITAAVAKASISRITAKGQGKERKITRLQIRFVTNYEKDVEHFCGVAYDETVWVALEDSQTSFGEDEGDEE
jgi:hypothetical protein